MDVCDLEMDSVKAVLLNQPLLHTFRCPAWLHTSPLNMANLQLTFRYALKVCFALVHIERLWKVVSAYLKLTLSFQALQPSTEQADYCD